jgi:hypothetical protein
MVPIADMRLVVAAIDDRPRHSDGGCTPRKQTPRPAAVASPMDRNRKLRPIEAGIAYGCAPSMGHARVGAKVSS